MKRQYLLAVIVCLSVFELSGSTRSQTSTDSNGATTGRIAFIDPKEPGGKLKVKQKGAAKYADATEGMEVRRGYLLDLDPTAKAAVVCNDGRPYELVAGRQSCPCIEQAGGIIYNRDSIPGTRGPDTTISRFPVAISPRKTYLLNTRPTFRWTPVAGSDGTVTYKVSVYKEPMKLVWSKSDIPKTELPYPSNETPLVQGETYIVIISASGSDSVEPQRDIGFTVLAAKDLDQIRAEESKIKQLSIPDTQKRFFIANLYATKGLNTEAIEILEDISKTMRTPAVLRMLGDLYATIGLNRQAERRYLECLSLPQIKNDPEGSALALQAIARTYQSLGALDEAVIKLDEAIKAYEELGDASTVEELKRIRQRIKKN